MADFDEYDGMLPSGYSLSVENIGVLMTRKSVADISSVESLAEGVNSDALKGISAEETIDNYQERKSMYDHFDTYLR